MNSGATPGTNDNDYSFKSASEDTEEAGTIASGKASVDFYCKDFGGYCDIRITLKKGTDTVFEITRGIPSDTKNGNNCADHWPGDVGPGAGSGAMDDTDDTPNPNKRVGVSCCSLCVASCWRRWNNYRSPCLPAQEKSDQPWKISCYVASYFAE